MKSALGCLAILGLLLASCAPAAAPTPTKAAPPPPTVAAPPSTKAPPATPKPAEKPAAPSPSPKPSAGEPKYGGILTTGHGGDPTSLDVHQETGAASYAITAAAYNGLVKYDPHAWPEQKVVPDLATSWEVSSDGKTYTFRLAKGAKFHDGRPFTAEDAKFSFDRMRGPKVGLTASPRSQQLAAIDSIATPDDSTVKIAMKYPQASFIGLIGSFLFAVVPKHVVLEKKDDMTKTVLGTGPFKFKSYSSGVSWELVKNPDYFVKGRPYLDGVKGYIIRDGFTRFAALRTKAILWFAPFPYMSVTQTKVIQEQLSDKIALAWAFHPAWYGALFNVTKDPWSDVRVRQAVSLTFNRKNMLAVGLEGAGVVGMSAQPPGEWALPEEEMMKVPGYAKPDIDASRKLLAEAGFASGFKTDMLVRAQKPQQDLAVLVKDAVAAVGITVDLNVQETAVYNSQRDRKAFALAAGSMGSSGTDPDTLLGDMYVSGSPRNWSGYSNAQYDELYVKQSRTIDATERRKTVWEMQRILLKDIPIAIVYWSNVPYAWWKEVRGYIPPVSFYNAFGYQDIWLAN
ncbi:MAG: ABC transporter substrate-binding protein [Chloroflexi bacterium]|nr:ABC transporter substrate-binding protein [Chloroflexota bacterium]